MADNYQSPLRQGPTPVGPQGPAARPQFDFQQLLQMILAAQTQQQGAAIDAATMKPSNIASSVRNTQNGRGRSLGLAGWYENNPHAMPGESYESSNAGQQAMIRGIRDQQGQTRALQDVNNRNSMAEALLKLQQLQGQLQGSNPQLGFTPMTGRYNPFAGLSGQ